VLRYIENPNKAAAEKAITNPPTQTPRTIPTVVENPKGPDERYDQVLESRKHPQGLAQPPAEDRRGFLERS